MSCRVTDRRAIVCSLGHTHLGRMTTMYATAQTRLQAEPENAPLESCNHDSCPDPQRASALQALRNTIRTSCAVAARDHAARLPAPVAAHGLEPAVWLGLRLDAAARAACCGTVRTTLHHSA